MPPPSVKAFSSRRRCSSIPASGWSLGKSSGVMPTTMAELAFCSSRAYWLMPLVTRRFGSEAAATTRPPGHMQNE
ncbi:hypothetical protein D3C78_1857230 [compost metagenome]